MIHSDSRTLDWIVQCGKDNEITDLTILEKTIRAFNNHFLKVSKSKGLFILKRPNDEAEFDTVGGAVNRIETRIHKTKDGNFIE